MKTKLEPAREFDHDSLLPIDVREVRHCLAIFPLMRLVPKHIRPNNNDTLLDGHQAFLVDRAERPDAGLGDVAILNPSPSHRYFVVAGGDGGDEQHISHFTFERQHRFRDLMLEADDVDYQDVNSLPCEARYANPLARRLACVK